MIDKAEIDKLLSEAIRHFWTTRLAQGAKQKKGGRTDQGARCEVTGGAQMDGFVKIIKEVICSNGFDRNNIFEKTCIQLPGYFRPEKQWDLAIVKDGSLVAAIEVKSQVGPSFGNNFNNRTEEALGSSEDLWTAYREGAFKASPQPWIGYLIVLEDCEASQRPVKVVEPHFEVFPEFKKASYAKRYELFCRKLILERKYTSAAFIISERADGKSGQFAEPAEDLTFYNFLKSLQAHVGAFI